jgi:hypothetical protein
MLPGPRDLSKHSRGVGKYLEKDGTQGGRIRGASPLLEETCRQKSEEKCRPKPAITMKL